MCIYAFAYTEAWALMSQVSMSMCSAICWAKVWRQTWWYPWLYLWRFRNDPLAIWKYKRYHFGYLWLILYALSRIYIKGRQTHHWILMQKPRKGQTFALNAAKCYFIISLGPIRHSYEWLIFWSPFPEDPSKLKGSCLRTLSEWWTVFLWKHMQLLRWFHWHTMQHFHWCWQQPLCQFFVL